jgi:hypothetical protein
MGSATYQLGYCKMCCRNVPHFRGRTRLLPTILNVATFNLFRFGHWYCGQCEFRSQHLRRVRRNKLMMPTNETSLEQTETVGNYIKSDGSLVLRKKRSSRYTNKFREGVVQRLLSGKTNIAQLTTELGVTEYDLLSWVNDALRTRDDRIRELNGLLRSFQTAYRVGISDESIRFDENENLIDGSYEHRETDEPSQSHSV